MSRIRTLAEQNRLDAQEEHVTRLWLQGWKPPAIAQDAGISTGRCYQVLRLARKLLNDGDYDEELAANAAAGFTNLPVKGQSRAGRPPIAFTDTELAVRMARAAGKSLAAIGHSFRLSKYQVRDILAKRDR